MILTLQSGFSAAHLYHQPLWSSEENLKNFGRCFTEHGHGHNYTLEVGFHLTEGEVQVKLEEYKSLLKNLTSFLDHEHLNFVIPEFKTTIPTTENIALYFLEKLKEHLPEKQIAHIRLYETSDIWTEIQP
ncbi:6-carboxytetrahydropterin synthase [Bdellovibrio sp. HCB288]|uniref:6-carboxytetrahydropterin synthase n=1 Tax=Bdellovibrio sp. HCB288 TaxID=3394355 RepID=UPI0039B4B522